MTDVKTERRKMSSSTVTVSEENIKRVENYLKGYGINRRLLMMKNYEKKYFDTCEWESETPVEFAVVRAKMYQIRHFCAQYKEFEREASALLSLHTRRVGGALCRAFGHIAKLRLQT